MEWLKYLKTLLKWGIVGIAQLFGLFFISLNADNLHQKFLLHSQGYKVVLIMQDTGYYGTGFHVKAPSGQTYILTNKHVCLPLKEDKSIYGDNPLWKMQLTKLKVLKLSDTDDLCLISSNPELAIDGITVANKEPDLGDAVTVIGHPAKDFLTKVKGDIVYGPFPARVEQVDLEANCKMETLKTKEGEREACIGLQEAYRLNVIIEPGSSGSPVLNGFGQLIGVIFSKATDQTAKADMIPASRVELFLKDM